MDIRAFKNLTSLLIVLFGFTLMAYWLVACRKNELAETGVAASDQLQKFFSKSEMSDPTISAIAGSIRHLIKGIFGVNAKFNLTFMTAPEDSTKNPAEADVNFEALGAAGTVELYSDTIRINKWHIKHSSKQYLVRCYFP